MLVATVATAGAASGAFVDMEPSGAVTFASSPKLTFRAGGRAVECTTTLHGRMRAGPISLAEGTAGEVTEGTMSSCAGGTVRELLFRERWTIKAETTLGTAPNEVTGVVFKIEGFAFALSTFGEFLNCLYSGTVKALMPLTGTAYYEIGTLRVLESSSLRKVSGFGCPESGTIIGNLSLTPGETKTLITEVADILNDFTKGRFVPSNAHDWGLVAESAAIAYNFEFESRTALRVTGTRVVNNPDFTVTGLNVGEILAAANYPLVATLRTRAGTGRIYVADYILLTEDRGGNNYSWLFIMTGRT